MHRFVAIPLIGVIILVAAAAPAASEWIKDGIPISAAIGAQFYQDMVRLETGDVVVVWMDTRGAATDIYAQRIDPYGNALWMEDGVPVCTETGQQYYPTVVSDGLGGVIVAWQDYRGVDYDIYAQRLGPDGTKLWMPGGVAICTAVREQEYAKAVSDGDGGAIITWRDTRYSVDDMDIYAQRVDAYGVVQWTPNGVIICYATGHQYNPQIISDSAGGAVVAWDDMRISSDQDIYAQRINSAGGVLWTPNGAPVCIAADFQHSLAMVAGQSGGTLIAWEDARNGSNYDIYAQLINATGSVSWATNGIPVCTAASDQLIDDVIADGSGGMIVSWSDLRNGTYDVYAQRVSRAGSTRWASDGVAVCAETGMQGASSMVSDDAGGAVIVWPDLRFGSEADIYAQRIEGAFGNGYWTSNGVQLCGASGVQGGPLIASDGAGGAIAFWRDERSGSGIDLYANRIERNGFWGFPCPQLTSLEDVPHDQGGHLMLTWNASRLDHWSEAGIQYYSIWRKLPMAQTRALLESGVKETAPEEMSLDFGGTAYRFHTEAGVTSGWEWLANVEGHYLPEYSYTASTLFDSTGADPGWHYFFVSAHCYSTVFWNSPPGLGYSVDDLAPCPPLYLAGEQSYVPAGLALNWPANHEPDLGGYHVYRGTDPGFVPAPANMVASMCDTVFLDEDWTWYGGYCYKVAAVDIHGNESGYALLRPDDVTGVEVPNVPDASYLSQNFPNPFNPTTRISFGLEIPASVSLCVYDAAGRLVRAIAEGSRPAGRYVEIWDGRNAHGEAMASGVYFYRLDAGAFTQTKKMILLR